LASAASGRMSGCLIFQRPDICSTTSLESIRTWTAASGSRARAARSPAIRPLYSATLLVAVPMYSATSASGSPVTASRTTAPYPAGPGLPREPPSASTMKRRRVIAYSPDSGVRTRIRRQFSHRTTVSAAADRTSFSSVMASSWRQPSQRRW
jgi:hypothetical protein